jgi:hypothetical protein
LHGGRPAHTFDDPAEKRTKRHAMNAWPILSLAVRAR